MVALRTPRERTGMLVCPRDARGRLLRMDALARFAAKCRFDPTTGCVLWTGGTSAGRGNTTRYGRFRDDGFAWYAHRWAAVHIHGLDLGKGEAGHCCPHGPNSLCVQHLAPTTKADNVAERNTRVAAAKRAEQSGTTRQFWRPVERGYEELPDPPAIDAGDVPFYDPPEWLLPFMANNDPGDCPF